MEPLDGPIAIWFVGCRDLDDLFRLTTDSDRSLDEARIHPQASPQTRNLHVWCAGSLMGCEAFLFGRMMVIVTILR
jgi:hypothetical protein